MVKSNMRIENGKAAYDENPVSNEVSKFQAHHDTLQIKSNQIIVEDAVPVPVNHSGGGRY